MVGLVEWSNQARKFTYKIKSVPLPQVIIIGTPETSDRVDSKQKYQLGRLSQISAGLGRPRTGQG